MEAPCLLGRTTPLHQFHEEIPALVLLEDAPLKNDESKLEQLPHA
jgi:hypothetical protein